MTSAPSVRSTISNLQLLLICASIIISIGVLYGKISTSLSQLTAIVTEHQSWIKSHQETRMAEIQATEQLRYELKLNISKLLIKSGMKYETITP